MADPNLGPVDDPGAAIGAGVVDDLREGAQPQTGRDRAAPLGE